MGNSHFHPAARGTSRYKAGEIQEIYKVPGQYHFLQRPEGKHSAHLFSSLLSEARCRSANIRELEGALNKLVAYENLVQTEITMEIAEKELQNIISPDIPLEVTDIWIFHILCIEVFF